MKVEFVVAAVVKSDSVVAGPFEGSVRDAPLIPRTAYEITARLLKQQRFSVSIEIKTVDPELAWLYQIGAVFTVELPV